MKDNIDITKLTDEQYEELIKDCSEEAMQEMYNKISDILKYLKKEN